MKVRFKKKQNKKSAPLLIVAGFILVPIGYESATLAGALFIIWISVVIAMLYDYEISAQGKLKDYALSIDIRKIHKIVDDGDSVVVHYDKKKDGSIKTRRFSPVKKEAFIEKLKEINPNIQII